jgi:hypothetical protein
MSEMEVISLQTGCKGRVTYRRVGVWDSLVGRPSRKTSERDQGSKFLDTGSLC